MRSNNITKIGGGKMACEAREVIIYCRQDNWLCLWGQTKGLCLCGIILGQQNKIELI